MHWHQVLGLHWGYSNNKTSCLNFQHITVLLKRPLPQYLQGTGLICSFRTYKVKLWSHFLLQYNNTCYYFSECPTYYTFWTSESCFCCNLSFSSWILASISFVFISSCKLKDSIYQFWREVWETKYVAFAVK